MAYTREQLQNLRLAQTIGRKVGATRKEQKAAIEAMLVESGARNLSYGDRDSQGILQQRSSQGWAHATNPAGALKDFYSHARTLRGQGLRPREIAQGVQRSAFPERYGQRAAEAGAVLGSNPGGSLVGSAGVGPAGVDPRARQAVLLNYLANRDRPDALLNLAEELGSLSTTATYGQPAPPVSNGRVKIDGSADRAGVATHQAVIDFADRVSSIAGTPVRIGTGTNHSRLTVNGNVSDHWAGNAADIPATGTRLIRLGQAALIAAGMPERKARKQTGGGFNFGDWQVIFNTNEAGWGDHTTHLHVGRRR